MCVIQEKLDRGKDKKLERGLCDWEETGKRGPLREESGGKWDRSRNCYKRLQQESCSRKMRQSPDVTMKANSHFLFKRRLFLKMQKHHGTVVVFRDFVTMNKNRFSKDVVMSYTSKSRSPGVARWLKPETCSWPCRAHDRDLTAQQWIWYSKVTSSLMFFPQLRAERAVFSNFFPPLSALEWPLQTPLMKRGKGRCDSH